tara:strand:+ start:1241 stop:1651 length:411 start_codon:yes stop_codon:yes gene_type:complete
MGFLDDLAGAAMKAADAGVEDCVVCGKGTSDRDEVTGIPACNKCKDELGQKFTETTSIEVSTLAPSGSYSVVSPVSVLGSGKVYQNAFNAVTFKLKGAAVDVGAKKICGTQYQFRIARSSAGNQVIEIMAFGTAIK